jgi:hypothetical protein
MTRLYFALLILTVGSLPTVTIAGVIHEHCYTDQWHQTFSFEQRNFSNSPEFEFTPTDYSDGSGANCFYEVSDITAVTATFGALTEPNPIVSITLNPTAGDEITVAIGDPITLGFLAHTVGDEFLFSYGSSVEIGFSPVSATRQDGSSSDAIIRNAVLSVSGTHYWVPEPSTALLLAFAPLASLLSVLKQARRSGRQSEKAENERNKGPGSINMAARE